MPWGNFTEPSQPEVPKSETPGGDAERLQIDVENPEFAKEMIHKCGEKWSIYNIL